MKTNNMGYFIIFFGCFLFSCGFPSLCDDVNTYERVWGYEINEYKSFIIINQTNKTYTNNALYWLGPSFKNEKWEFPYQIKDKYHATFYQKINRIEPNKTINRNEIGNLLKLGGSDGTDCYYDYEYRSEERLFLLSLDGGERKIFFGAYGGAYGKHVERHYGEVTSDCKQHVIKYDIHPVWQKKDLTITIEKNGKIKFSDPKIKEVKKLKLTIDGKTEVVDPYALELVDCSKE